MNNSIKKRAALFTAAMLLLSGCGKGSGSIDKNGQNINDIDKGQVTSTASPAPSSPLAENMPGNPNSAGVEVPGNTAVPSPGEGSSGTVQTIDYEKVKPNEAGKVMVVMFHNFVEQFTPTKYDNGEYTTTFDEFRKLLDTLYSKGYRLVNLNDFVNNRIDVTAGCVPIIFTFDDGTAGQFSLTEENGKLTVNKNSAVGILEEFNKTHPDFGMKGTFYVNLGLSTFEGKGTLSERLKHLTDMGFEIGNHTYTHVSLPQVRSAEKIQEEIGGNQKKMLELIPGYKMQTFSLPYGQASKDLTEFVNKGQYNGVEYEHMAVMEVGAGPTLSVVHKNSVPLSMSRVRASGMKKVDADLDWWLKTISRSDEYISDGNPDTVTVPKDKESFVDIGRLKGKKLVTY